MSTIPVISSMAIATERTDFIRTVCILMAIILTIHTLINIHTLVAATRKSVITLTSEISISICASCVIVAIMYIGRTFINILAQRTVP